MLANHFVFVDGRLIGTVNDRQRSDMAIDHLRGIEFLPVGGVLRIDGNDALALTKIRRKLEHREMIQGVLF